MCMRVLRAPSLNWLKIGNQNKNCPFSGPPCPNPKRMAILPHARLPIAGTGQMAFQLKLSPPSVFGTSSGSRKLVWDARFHPAWSNPKWGKGQLRSPEVSFASDRRSKNERIHPTFGDASGCSDLLQMGLVEGNLIRFKRCLCGLDISSLCHWRIRAGQLASQEFLMGMCQIGIWSAIVWLPLHQAEKDTPKSRHTHEIRDSTQG